MKTEFHIIIPARYHSTRLPGKLLMDLNGQTVLERVYRQAMLTQAKSITIATDHRAIFDLAQTLGAPVVMTKETHPTGTDRIAEVVSSSAFAPNDVIVNVQGDEPLIEPTLITQVAQSLQNEHEAHIATLCWPIEELSMLTNPNVVKVVRDSRNYALYFSRSTIPANRDEPSSLQNVFRHIGLYAYRAAFLLEIVSWPVCDLERIESLEQLRVLWAGHKIKVEVACQLPRQDINTADDLARAREHYQN